MECHICGKWAGAACRHCDRGVCNSHGTFEQRVWVCQGPDEVCLEARGEEVTVEELPSLYGQCPHTTCTCDLVIVNDSGELKCPAHGYVGKKAPRPSKVRR